MNEIENELAEIDKEIAEMQQQYDKARKHGFIAGCVSISLAIIFSILSIILKQPNAIYGIILQFISAIILLIVNRKFD